MISKHLRTKQSQTKSPKATTEMLEDISELFGYESTRVFLDVSSVVFKPTLIRSDAFKIVLGRLGSFATKTSSTLFSVFLHYGVSIAGSDAHVAPLHCGRAKRNCGQNCESDR